MRECWWCKWGWRKEVAEIYIRAAKALIEIGSDPMDALQFGPGHIVWSDENFDSAGWCLEHFDEYTRDLTMDEQAIVRRSLEELAALPADLHDLPDGYSEDDMDDPSETPPPADWKMVTKDEMRKAIYGR